MSSERRTSIQQAARILIVDDHPMMREGLSVRISTQPDMRVCGEASDVDEALRQVQDLHPDLVIVDLSLRRGHGLDLIERIKAGHPTIKMLVVSQFDEALYAERSLRAGAQGYINKRECQEKILLALREVLAGRCYVSPEMTAHLVARAIDGGGPPGMDPVQRLSNRELEVFQLIGQGVPTSSIARQLHVSVHTVESHREKIRHKLGLKNGAELMRCAVQWVMEKG
jgi:DNA-binding NarL/FixJ family response regulator